MEKQFKGKIIYNPKGKAKEYSFWAANFFKGCSGNCYYCYLKKGVLKANWFDKPVLKTSLINETNAKEIFRKELKRNLKSLREHGLFFNFSSDPCLKETYDLNWNCIDWSLFADVPVIILTKQTWWVKPFIESKCYENLGDKLKIGFTVTGHDELEPGCSSNADRIDAMISLKKAGYYVWSSIEPVIKVNDSVTIVENLINMGVCDHYKIGLESGKEYDIDELTVMILYLNNVSLEKGNNTIYWKNSLLNKAGVIRNKLPENCVKSF